MRWAAAARLCWARTLRSHCPAWRVPQQAARGRPSGRGRYIQSFIAGSRLPESDSCQHASCRARWLGRHFRSLRQLVVRNSDGEQRAFRLIVAHASGPFAGTCRMRSPLFNVPIPGHGSIIVVGRAEGKSSSPRADHSRPPGLENPVSPPLRTYFVASRTVWFFRRPLDPGRRGLRRLRVGAVTAPAAPIEHARLR